MFIKRERILNAPTKSDAVLALSIGGQLLDGAFKDCQISQSSNPRARVTDCVVLKGTHDLGNTWGAIEVAALKPLLPETGDLDTNILKDNDLVLEAGLPVGLTQKKAT